MQKCNGEASQKYDLNGDWIFKSDQSRVSTVEQVKLVKVHGFQLGHSATLDIQVSKKVKVASSLRHK